MLHIKRKTFFQWSTVLACISCLVACNDDWKDEQYEKYLSFSNSGVNKIYLKYESEGGKKTYRLPILVSGSTMPDHDIRVALKLDPDTIQGYNQEKFHSRTDLFFEELPAKFYEMPLTTIIPSGSPQGYIDIDFELKGLDNYYKHFLTLEIDPSSDLPANPKKHYKKTLMHIMPFNDFSGKYQVTSELIEIDENGEEIGVDRIKVEERESWVVDENTIFFYAGMTDEEALYRREYQINAKFIEDRDDNLSIDGWVELSCENPEIEFTWEPTQCTYRIAEAMDDVKPYLKRKYVIMELEYTYLDITYPEAPLRYKYKGPLIMERVLNIQKPEEDQIEWQ